MGGAETVCRSDRSGNSISSWNKTKNPTESTEAHDVDRNPSCEDYNDPGIIDTVPLLDTTVNSTPNPSRK